ncbi:hypothetical protein [Amycolatopsis samaneae]|uniref:Uncharacterized protein n=1 Tax=Amycolatopsis samaneae TaxID=664691 RepID=A0ABW5G7V1_9PSEU
MLHAKKTGLSGREYVITLDGKELTTFSAKRLSGGQFTLGETGYQVRAHRFTRVHKLLDANGRVLAETDRVSRRWQLRASGKVFSFQRNSLGGRAYTLLGERGEPTGSITLSGPGSASATAELPGLAPELQVFALAVALMRRRKRRAAAAVRAGTLPR